MKNIAGKTFSTLAEAGLEPLPAEERAEALRALDEAQREHSEAPTGPHPVSRKFWDDTSGTEFGQNENTETGSGPSLRQHVARHGPLPESGVRALGIRLGHDLTDAHSRGDVRGTLTPDTVAAGDGPDPGHTGEPLDGFAAPEVAVGAPDSPAADVFALGALLVFAATGNGPFGKGTPQLLRQRVVGEQPNLVWVPPALTETLRRCLAKDPAHRPSAAEVAELLDDTTRSDR